MRQLTALGRFFMSEVTCQPSFLVPVGLEGSGLIPPGPGRSIGTALPSILTVAVFSLVAFFTSRARSMWPLTWFNPSALSLSTHFMVAPSAVISHVVYSKVSFPTMPRSVSGRLTVKLMPFFAGDGAFQSKDSRAV